MSKFKVGDRVAVFGGLSYFGHFDLILNGARGRVSSLEAALHNDYIRVELDRSIDGTTDVEVHPKQCRKLVKKERRRITVTFVHLTGGGTYTKEVDKRPIDSYKDDETVEFIEVPASQRKK